ncbi:aspartate/glutamate racemase family protein [Roseospira marina]|uniref:Aspartate/glutamate racemase family protein n=1 Tax=Roseospira marina TaxID=140057 RepID=A0A5M6IES8_9PROT|nr:aspartate/glutamate racemase family protein [Roseospira marina]KAA5606780.1 aspartate/glutamate racemase family protein [Roseospira marina]MBB4313798.1 Asp/Glu/hydantoin racemase [Roseospira marina]MBB5086960.1 Asp/Glu/hydantoin racemase [Roseospira marina]
MIDPFERCAPEPCLAETHPLSNAPVPEAMGPVGVIMLNTRFPRLPGDIGHPDTFEGRVLYRRVDRARVGAVVRSEAVEEPLVRDLIDAARALEAEGARVIATSCGFLGALQERLRAAVSVPVLSSALVLVPLLRAAYGPRGSLGVLTFDARALKPAHFGAMWDPDLLVEGLESSRTFYPAIAEDQPTLDAALAEGDAAMAAQRLRGRAGGRLGAVILECTNLGPYSRRIRMEADAPVFDLAMAVRWMTTGLLSSRSASG